MHDQRAKPEGVERIGRQRLLLLLQERARELGVALRFQTEADGAATFARDWVLENKAGQPSFKATRARNAAHPIEEVGERLRAMMPWISKNKLVDKAKN